MEKEEELYCQENFITPPEVQRVALSVVDRVSKQSGVDRDSVRKILNTLQLTRTLASVGEVVGNERIESIIRKGELAIAILDDRHILAA